jgi:hypothetical protein
LAASEHQLAVSEFLRQFKDTQPVCRMCTLPQRLALIVPQRAACQPRATKRKPDADVTEPTQRSQRGICQAHQELPFLPLPRSHFPHPTRGFDRNLPAQGFWQWEEGGLSCRYRGTQRIRTKPVPAGAPSTSGSFHYPVSLPFGSTKRPRPADLTIPVGMSRVIGFPASCLLRWFLRGGQPEESFLCIRSTRRNWIRVPTRT